MDIQTRTAQPQISDIYESSDVIWITHAVRVGDKNALYDCGEDSLVRRVIGEMCYYLYICGLADVAYQQSTT
jgi:hypothetical protein